MPKYPSPEEATKNFLEAVKELATQRKWGARSAAGAEKLSDWFKRGLPAIYNVIASDDFQTEEDPWERSRMVGTEVQEQAKEYRKEKLKALVTAVVGSPE